MEKLLSTRKTAKKTETLAINKPVRVRKASAKSKGNGVDRAALVAEAAYYLAEKRGFAPGKELEDWFEAERIVASVQPSSQSAAT
jgi:hypothetical protein